MRPDLAIVFVRSTVFHLLAFLTAAVYCLALPILFLPRRWVVPILFSFLRVFLWQLKVVCGLDFEVKGTERIPDGQVMFASKHQSAWETVALTLLLKDPVFVVKRELFWIPVVGWTIKKMGHVGVRRTSGFGSLAKMVEEVRVRASEGRNVVIFPEGTRGDPREDVQFKHGVGVLYRALGIACLPVALNSGEFWPRRSWFRYPGKITIKFLEPIQPGLDTETFMSTIKETIEIESRAITADQRTPSRNRDPSGHFS